MVSKNCTYGTSTLTLFSVLPPFLKYKRFFPILGSAPGEHQMPPHWQLCPFIKENQANKGLVFPELEKQAGLRVGLDFKALKGRSSDLSVKSRKALSLTPEVAGLGSVPEWAGPKSRLEEASQACLLRKPIPCRTMRVAKWQTTRSLQGARTVRKLDVRHSLPPLGSVSPW